MYPSRLNWHQRASVAGKRATAALAGVAPVGNSSPCAPVDPSKPLKTRQNLQILNFGAIFAIPRGLLGATVDTLRLFQSSQFFAQSWPITRPKTYSKRSGFTTVGFLLEALQWGDPANFELEGEFKICKAPRVQNLQRPDQIEHSRPFPHRLSPCPNSLRGQPVMPCRRTSSIPAVRRWVQI